MTFGKAINISPILGVGSLIMALGLSLTACSSPEGALPPSLEAPVKMATVDGEVCLPDVDSTDGTISSSPLMRCDDGGQGFALVANARSGKISVVALGQSQPRLVNLDARRPGVTHIDVGTRPIDVAVMGDGTAAVVIDQMDKTLRAIDMWTLRPLEEIREIEGTPRAVASLQFDDGQPGVALLASSPNRLEVHPGLRCERPADNEDRRDYMPDATCDWGDGDVLEIPLPGRPVDMAVDAYKNRAWVIYRDLNIMSWIALSEDALGADEACLEDGETPPCEVARTGWSEDDEDEDQVQAWGATQVDYDPLGLFVYVLDRPNNQMLVFDRERQSLIDASLATEPPLAPFSTQPGITLSRSAMAMSAEVRRVVLTDGDPALVRYELGAQVAADNGQLYRVGVADIECVFTGGGLLNNNDFRFDPELREASPESSCLFIPALPLGGDPDFDSDEELLASRFYGGEGDTALAITPVFGLRDIDARQGRLVGRAQCVHPEALTAAVREEGGEAATLGCGSPFVPQPVALDVADDLANYTDAPRANLMTFVHAEFHGEAPNFEPTLVEEIYDLRLRNERWTVTYEGALPGLGNDERGLVSRQEEGVFLSGGANYCAAGVEVGDHLRILSNPADGPDCEPFEGVPAFRTYEITDVGAFDVEIAVLDEEDRVAELPTRSCFDRGLRYEIIPRGYWTVVGEQSGMASPWERDGNECVLGEEAASGLLNGRVETGEEFHGPYLRFRIREGDVDPVRGTAYSFQVERNFRIDAFQIVPGAREGSQSTLPSQVLFTPDLGFGRYVVVIDSGADRIYLRHQTRPDDGRFLR